MLYSIDLKRFHAALGVETADCEVSQPESQNQNRGRELEQLVSYPSKPKQIGFPFSDKQFSDKKNVLRKIGTTVKRIIFSRGDWVARHTILTEIYRLDREHHEFSDSSHGTVTSFNQLLNLKRRVYDSLSVLSSAVVISSKRETVDYATRRELFYRACIPSGNCHSI